MTQLPLDIWYHEILNSIPIENILLLKRTNKYLYSIISKNYWKLRWKNDTLYDQDRFYFKTFYFYNCDFQISLKQMDIIRDLLYAKPSIINFSQLGIRYKCLTKKDRAMQHHVIALFGLYSRSKYIGTNIRILKYECSYFGIIIATIKILTYYEVFITNDSELLPPKTIHSLNLEVKTLNFLSKEDMLNYKQTCDPKYIY